MSLTRGSPGLMSRREVQRAWMYPTWFVPGRGDTLSCDLSHNSFNVTYPLNRQAPVKHYIPFTPGYLIISLMDKYYWLRLPVTAMYVPLYPIVCPCPTKWQLVCRCMSPCMSSCTHCVSSYILKWIILIGWDFPPHPNRQLAHINLICINPIFPNHPLRKYTLQWNSVAVNYEKGSIGH